MVQEERQADNPACEAVSVQAKYLGVTMKEAGYGLVPQHHGQRQPNKVEQDPKEVEVEVLYVHAGVHVPLESHLIVDRGQAGNGDAA